MKTPQTRQPKLANELGVKNLFFKREDKHPYGSHKGRSIPTMMVNYIREGIAKFIVSSSGNSALAAIRKAKEYNQQNKGQIQLKVFIGEKIDETKKKGLEQEIGNSSQIILEQVSRPKQTAFQLNKQKEDLVYLRQSRDNIAAFGYQELAKELDQILNLKAVFIPTSSGTTVEGLTEGFIMQKQSPELHIVQTEYCHPIAEEFDQRFSEKEDLSIADAIVDKVAHRKQNVVEAVNKSGGSGWILKEKEIKQAKNLVESISGLDISYNSALSVAGVQKATKEGCTWDGTVCCLICGK